MSFERNSKRSFIPNLSDIWQRINSAWCAINGIKEQLSSLQPASTQYSQITIQELRDADSFTKNSFIITDENLEGLFVYDSDDTTSSDDGISVLVKGGKRYIRKNWRGLPYFIPAANSQAVISRFLKTGNTYYGLISQYTGLEITANLSTLKLDGTPITNTDVDNIVYFKFSDDNFGIRAWNNGQVNPDEFGASADADATLAFTKALSVSSGLVLSDKRYLIDTMTFPSDKVITFKNGARILFKYDAEVVWTSKIEAAEDAWIFECQDDVTNYTNENTSVTTKQPLKFNGTTQLSDSITTPIPVKWFGVKGGGYKTGAISAYYGSNTIPTTEFVNDTKAIRFALTSVADGSEMPESNGFAYGGAMKLMFPKGCFTVNDELFVSSGTFIQGVGSSQGHGTVFMQMNPSKALFVLQSAGSGGTGGGGSCHVLSDFSYGTRPTSVSNPGSCVVRFEDNKFNLDSRFFRLRLSNCPFNGSVFYANGKRARENGENGYQNVRGLRVTFHMYDCMNDVIEGDYIRVGEYSVMGVRIYNSQFYNVFANLVNTVPKNYTNFTGDVAGQLDSFYEFNNCNFEGIGTSGSSAMYINDERSSLKLNECEFESRIVDNAWLGNYFHIERAHEVYISGGKYSYPSLNGSDPDRSGKEEHKYFLLLNGFVDNLFISDVKLFKSNTRTDIALINLGPNFHSDCVQINDNTFKVSPQTLQCIYCENPSIASVGVVVNNTFFACATQAIVGNTNPGLIFKDNVFMSAQDVKSTSLANYGMKGRTVRYGEAPSGGYRGDILLNTQPSENGIKQWVCISDGVWSDGTDMPGLDTLTRPTFNGNPLPIQAEAPDDTAETVAPGGTVTANYLNGVLDELRDLKTKGRVAGLWE